MRTTDSARWLLRSLAAGRLRSFLTALGIAIGIAAVTLLTSIGEGIRVYLMDSFTQFGTRIIAVTAGRTETHGVAGLLSTVRPLSLADAQSLATLPHVDAVVPVVQGTGRIEAGRYARDTDIYGVGPDMARAWRFAIARGRFLPGPGLEDSRYHAVLGSRVHEELFGNASALGEYVRIGGARFQVVGVMQSKGRFLGFDLDDAVYIPADIGLALFNRSGLMEIDVMFRASTSGERMGERVSALLRARHGEEDFTLFTQEDMLKSLDRILGMLKTAIGAIGGVALLVGGVGVLTIMSSALSERVEEIGLLRALGATRRQVLALFLGEAVLLSLGGGALGLGIVGLLIALLRALAPGLPIAIEPLYALASLALSCGVGLAAGIVPALDAAALDPIEALRTD
jgi:putative ABC transport system permease protein